MLAIEVGLSDAVRPGDESHLNWPASQAPDVVVDKAVINTGSFAYRRKNGVAVILLVLLAP